VSVFNRKYTARVRLKPTRKNSPTDRNNTTGERKGFHQLGCFKPLRKNLSRYDRDWQILLQLKILIGSSCLFTSFFAFAQSPVPPGAVAERIATGFQFVEGPVWSDRLGLLFSDIPANTVYRWKPDSGVSVYLRPSGNSNGLAFDSRNRLLLAQHGNRRLARRDSTGAEVSVASHYNGKRLNSPNDLAIKSDGAIFFTDPPYGISPNQEELGFYGIYRISPSGALQLLDNSLQRPNGIAFSPDETKLYVTDSPARNIYAWDVVNDSLLANKRLIAHINPAGNADGMKVDTEGNLFVTGPLGVWVFSPDGAVLDTILVPGQTTNCNWGDTDRRTLYITSGSSVYRIRLADEATTVSDPVQESSTPHSFELHAIHPNPFNPEAIIRYALPKSVMVEISVYDALGNLVEILARQRQNAGVYSLKWHAGNRGTGVYFFRMQAGRYVKVTKGILLK
jgi:gluconolactonase